MDFQNRQYLVSFSLKLNILKIIDKSLTKCYGKGC